MRKVKWVAPKGKDAKKEAAAKPKIAGDGETAEAMRQATKGKKKPSKPHTLDEVIELLHKHGIRFSDEE
jgi:hypothetical protein